MLLAVRIHLELDRAFTALSKGQSWIQVIMETHAISYLSVNGNPVGDCFQPFDEYHGGPRGEMQFFFFETGRYLIIHYSPETFPTVMD